MTNATTLGGALALLLAAPIAAGPTTDRLAGWLDANGEDPVAYTVSLFEDADVVLLGETHEVADTCEFVASLLGPLRRDAGVRVIAMESLRSSLNRRIRAVVTDAEWDDEAAIDLFREGPWPTWGYREYVDILKAAWEVNRALPDGADPLIVVGIDDDWRQIDLLRAERADRFDMVRAREANMVETVEAEAFGAGRKALVHVGFAHAAFAGGERLGQALRDAHGQRVTNIVVHHSVRGPDGPSRLTKTLVAAFAARGDGGPVAFRVRGSPFDDLRDPESMYGRFLGPDVNLGSFIEHYAFLTPLDEERPVTWIPGFIREDRLEEAIEIGERTRWIEPGTVTTVEEANRAFAGRFEGR